MTPDPFAGQWVYPRGTHHEEADVAAVPEGSVVITPAQVYEKVVTLTEVVTKLVAADEVETKARATLDARVERLETDVMSIKQKLWFVAGICSAIGGGFGSAIASALAK